MLFQYAIMYYCGSGQHMYRNTRSVLRTVQMVFTARKILTLHHGIIQMIYSYLLPPLFLFV